MNYRNIAYEKENAIAVLTINRPGVLNSLNGQTLREIASGMECFSADNEALVLIITGAGDRAFVAGADIEDMAEMDALRGMEFGTLGNRAFQAISSCEKPVIAAVNGYCLGGGCELAMACDFRICSDTGTFGQPEVGLGIIPGFGGTQRLQRLVGQGMAKQLLFTGELIDAHEALRIGLVNRVVPGGELMRAAKSIAEKIASRGADAVRFCKIAVTQGADMDLDRALRMESALFGLCFSTADQKERMKAFLDRKKKSN